MDEAVSNTQKNSKRLLNKEFPTNGADFTGEKRGAQRRKIYASHVICKKRKCHACHRSCNCHKSSETLVFFDRSIIDSYGYSMLEGIPISDKLLEHCQTLEYHTKVFIFPPWESIFENDEERKQDFDEAVTTYQEMVSAFKKFGYSLVEVPKVSVRERVEFIFQQLKNG